MWYQLPNGPFLVTCMQDIDKTPLQIIKCVCHVNSYCLFLLNCAELQKGL